MKDLSLFGLLVVCLFIPLTTPEARNGPEGHPISAPNVESNEPAEGGAFFAVSAARLEWDSFAYNLVLDSIERVAGPYGVTTKRIPLSSRGIQLIYGDKAEKGFHFWKVRLRYIEATTSNPLFYYAESLSLPEIPYFAPQIPGIPTPSDSTLQGVNAGGMVFLSGRSGLLRRYDILLENGWFPWTDSTLSFLRPLALLINLEFLRDYVRPGGQALANFNLTATNPSFQFDYSGALGARSTTVADWGRLRPGVAFELKPGDFQAFFIRGDLIYGRGRAVNEIELNSFGRIAYTALSLPLPLALGMRTRLETEQTGYSASAGYRFDFGGIGMRIWYEYESVRIRILDLKSELRGPAVVFTVLGNPYLMLENTLLESIQRADAYQEWQRGIHIALSIPTGSK